MQIEYSLLPTSARKLPPTSEDNLNFGVIRTNHLFLMDYSEGEWHNARMAPYQPLTLMPGAMCLHYGQTLFEGIKAFRHQDGEIYTFRADKNAERLNSSADSLCMPRIPVDMQLEALHRLIDVERDWCPSVPQSSLYIRPFMFATEDALGVKPSKSYVFCIFLSPSGPYYKGGFHPIRLLVTTKYHRAVSGGLGASKVGGNYAASLRPAEDACKFNAEQVLYLNEANTHIEEVGSMNHYHVTKNGVFVIPTFTDSILRSVTSLSVLELAAAGRLQARQEPVAVQAFLNGLQSGDIIEAGGLGTAAVVSPVGCYVLEDGSEVRVNNGEIGEYSRALYEMYSAIQTGGEPAPEGWLAKVARY